MKREVTRRGFLGAAGTVAAASAVAGAVQAAEAPAGGAAKSIKILAIGCSPKERTAPRPPPCRSAWRPPRPSTRSTSKSS